MNVNDSDTSVQYFIYTVMIIEAKSLHLFEDPSERHGKIRVIVGQMIRFV